MDQPTNSRCCPIPSSHHSLLFKDSKNGGEMRARVFRCVTPPHRAKSLLLRQLRLFRPSRNRKLTLRAFARTEGQCTRAHAHPHGKFRNRRNARNNNDLRRNTGVTQAKQALIRLPPWPHCGAGRRCAGQTQRPRHSQTPTCPRSPLQAARCPAAASSAPSCGPGSGLRAG